MTDKKADLKNLLENGRQQLLQAVAGITDWTIPVQSEGERWTALQMIRHLQDAHTGLTGELTRLLQGQDTVPADFDIDRWNARAQRKTAEAALTPEQAIENLKASHQRLLNIVDEMTEADYEKTGWQAFVKKQLTAVEFIQVIAAHEAGHAAELAAAQNK